MKTITRYWLAVATLSTMIFIAGVSLAAAEPLADKARAAILANFDGERCPVVFLAERNPDGSIDALCTNRETFLIGKVSTGEVAAIRCSAFEDRSATWSKRMAAHDGAHGLKRT